MAKSPERKSISKSLRFEVFKRDLFKCKYCGRAAPEVVLHVDHLNPVIAGGTNDILNLLTSCADCNLGKGRHLLSENAAMQKQRDALEELQIRREQLEMMVQWHEGLKSIKEDAVAEVVSYWARLTPGWSVTETGRATVKKWLKRLGVSEVLSAMDIAADQYLERDVEGRITSESWNKAFDKIPGICRVTKLEKDDPDIRELFYIRGI